MITVDYQTDIVAWADQQAWLVRNKATIKTQRERVRRRLNQTHNPNFSSNLKSA